MNLPGVAPPWLTGFSDFNATALEDALLQRRKVATMTKRSPGGLGGRAIAMGGGRGLGCVITGACGVVTLDMEDEEEDDDDDDDEDDPEGGGGGGRTLAARAAATRAMQLEEEDVRPYFSHLPVPCVSLVRRSTQACCYSYSLGMSTRIPLIWCPYASQEDTNEQDAAKAEMQTAMQNFIKGMLTNHSQLPLQGIHNKLTMFSTAPRAAAAAAAAAAAVTCLASLCLAACFWLR